MIKQDYKPSIKQVLNQDQDCGGGESFALWISGALITIITAAAAAYSLFKFLGA